MTQVTGRLEVCRCLCRIGSVVYLVWVGVELVELVERVELGVEVEGQVAEWSRDAEEGSGVRVRRSRCGPETPLAGRSIRHSPLPTPSINNSPPSR